MPLMRMRLTSAALLIAYLWPATGTAALAHLALAHGRAGDHHKAAAPEPVLRDTIDSSTDSASCLVCAQLLQFKKSSVITPTALDGVDNRPRQGPMAIRADQPSQDAGRDPIQARAPPIPLS